MLTRIDWKTSDAQTRQRLFERPSLGSDAVAVAQGILDAVRARGE
ncbi:MAG TPA: histidinol dehydrogenase, partial [Oceanicaulis sp.]|nr:histidinol dehydrogenase [Oceanicaulis sp.]